MIEYWKNLDSRDLFYINEYGLVCCEEWRDVPGYEGYYRASNLGRIKSLERFCSYVNANGKSIKRIVKERIMKQCFVENYVFIVLRKNNKQKNFFSHQLIAMCFLDHVPCRFKIVVDHINDNVFDNRANNLQLLTNRQNVDKGFKRKKLTSIYTGVYFNKSEKKFRSQIRIFHKKDCHLGYFKQEIDAHNAYQTAFKNLEKYRDLFSSPLKVFLIHD